MQEQTMDPIIIAAGVFFFVVLFILGLYYVLKIAPESDRRKKIKNRLQAISSPDAQEIEAEIDLVKKNQMSGVPLFNQLLSRFSQSNQLQKIIRQADLKLNVSTFVLLTLVLGTGGYLLSAQLIQFLALNLLAGAVGCAAPFLFILSKRKKRFRQFEKLFPDALDLLTRAVKAGHAFNTGIEMIAQEMPDPISKEFRTTFDEQNYGLPLKQALFNMIDRVPLLDLKFFTTAVLMQKETGGNLAEILMNLSHLIRERFKIQGEIRTYSAQGRLTGYILTFIPLAMGATISFMNWNYIKPLFYTKAGHYMLAIAIFGQLLGYIFIRKIVNIKI
jgi:tight adherence protein B